MTWSYTASATPSQKDYVRLLIGDTLSTDPQLQDEEIDAILADEGNDTLRAAVTCAEAVGGLYARRVSEGNRQAEALLKHYQDLAVRLRRKMARSGVAPFAGGQSQAAKEAQTENDDRVPPFFSRDQWSEPATDQSQTPTRDLFPPVY